MSTPPHQEKLGHVLMICGDQSGIGKTSACIGIINALCLKYDPNEIAYIKPCTQCESVQLLWKFCNNMGVQCHGIGPIVYRAGYTQECIDGKQGTAEDRLKLVSDAILTLRQKFKFVLVDGVGYPGVGSCIGCSNRDVAATIGCPVLMISRPGVGNMIDSCVMNIEYMAYKNVIIIGTIVNKIPKKVSYHTPDKIKEYATKFFETYQYTTRKSITIEHDHDSCETTTTTITTTNNNTKIDNSIITERVCVNKIQLYGFVASFDTDQGESCATSCATSCALKPNVQVTDFDLEITDNEWVELSRLLQAQTKAVNFDALFHDVAKYFE